MGNGVTPQKPLDAVVADWVSVFIKLFGGWSWNCEDMYTTCNWDTIITSQIIVISPDLDIQSLLVANNVACSGCRIVLIQPWFSVQGSLLCLILHPALSACTDCITHTIHHCLAIVTLWNYGLYMNSSFLLQSNNQTLLSSSLSAPLTLDTHEWLRQQPE